MSLKTLALASALLGLLLAVLPAAAAAPPDYKLWGNLLSKYYDPAKGMDYKGLKANDKKTLDDLRQQMAQVDVGALPRHGPARLLDQPLQHLGGQRDGGALSGGLDPRHLDRFHRRT